MERAKPQCYRRTLKDPHISRKGGVFDRLTKSQQHLVLNDFFSLLSVTELPKKDEKGNSTKDWPKVSPVFICLNESKKAWKSGTGVPCDKTKLTLYARNKEELALVLDVLSSKSTELRAGIPSGGATINTSSDDVIPLSFFDRESAENDLDYFRTFFQKAKVGKECLRIRKNDDVAPLYSC